MSVRRSAGCADTLIICNRISQYCLKLLKQGLELREEEQLFWQRAAAGSMARVRNAPPRHPRIFARGSPGWITTLLSPSASAQELPEAVTSMDWDPPEIYWRNSAGRRKEIGCGDKQREPSHRSTHLTSGKGDRQGRLAKGELQCGCANISAGLVGYP